MENNFEETINNMSDKEFNQILNEVQDFNEGPTVEEFMSQFKVCIFSTYAIEQLKELIDFYRKNNTEISQAAMYNLDNLEKNLNTAIDYNKFKQ